MVEAVVVLVLLMTHLIKVQQTSEDLVLEEVVEQVSQLELGVLLDPMVLMVLLL